MEEAKWIKLRSDIFSDEKMLLIASMPDGCLIQLVWIKLLCMAGMKNNGGVFSIGSNPYTESALSVVFGLPEQTIKAAIAAFEELNMTDRDELGCIRIINWDKHQSMKALEQKRERDRERRRIAAENRQSVSDASAMRQRGVSASPAQRQRVADIEENREDKKREEQITPITGVYNSFAAGDSVLEDALIAFEEMRTRIKAPLTDRARSLILSTLETFPRTEWVDVLNQSTANGWKSLRAVERPKAPAPAAAVQPDKYAASISDIDAMRRLHDHLAGSQ